eukprot:CCRYP_017768-RA/>CCRYP_017768-RA protein AED:0.49 eAED:1.00 QI:0/-1/0/1/-1/1/1/0/100
MAGCSAESWARRWAAMTASPGAELGWEEGPLLGCNDGPTRRQGAWLQRWLDARLRAGRPLGCHDGEPSAELGWEEGPLLGCNDGPTEGRVLGCSDGWMLG